MNTTPKIHILFPFQAGPWGGGNQLLAALRREYVRQGVWAETPDLANIVIFDSFHCVPDIVAWRRRLPDALFVHRINGPISKYRGSGLAVDHLIYALTYHVADAVIFQSRYTEQANIALGMQIPAQTTVIMNAPDHTVFYPVDAKPDNREKVRVMISSWSRNWNKGFKIYQYLDQHLDFSRYELTFVGNSPIGFDNIRCMPPVGSGELADLLRQHDMFVTASQSDPCSNALAEAMACGVVPVVLRSGGHPELVGNAGTQFTGEADVISAIENATENLESLRVNLTERSVVDVAQDYYDFACQAAVASSERKILGPWGKLAIRKAQMAKFASDKGLGLLRKFGLAQ